MAIDFEALKKKYAQPVRTQTVVPTQTEATSVQEQANRTAEVMPAKTTRIVQTPKGEKAVINPDRVKYADTTTEGLERAIRDNAGARLVSGFYEGLSPVSLRNAIEQKYGQDTLEALQDSKSYAVGQATGVAAQFAVPYAGATAKIGGALSKVGAFSKLGNIGQKVVRSATTDLAVGLPLNVNYALNKEKLTGEDALKSIWINTVIDLVAGGLIEVVPSAIKGMKKLVNKQTGETVIDAIPSGVDMNTAIDIAYNAPNRPVEPLNMGKGTIGQGEQIFAKKGDFIPLGNDVNEFLSEQKISKVRSNTLESMLSETEKAQATPELFRYDTISEAESLEKARQRLETDYAGEVNDLSTKESFSGEDLDTAMGILGDIRAEASTSGDYSNMLKWLKGVQEKGTTSGQFIQAFKKWGNTREGVLLKGQREIASAERKINEKYPKQIEKAKAEGSQVIESVKQAEKEAEDDVVSIIQDTVNKSGKVKTKAKRKTTTGADGLIDKAVKEIGIDIKDIILRNPQNREKALEDIKNYLQSRVGVDSEEAITLIGFVQQKYTDVANETNFKMLQNLIKERIKEAPASQYTKLKELLNMGAYNADMYEIPADKMTASTIRQALRDSGIDLAQIAKSSKEQREQTLESLKAFIMFQAGVPADDALVIAKSIAGQYNDLVAKRADSLLRVMFKETPKRNKKSPVDKVIELIHLGAYDDDRIRDLIKSKNGIPVLENADIDQFMKYMDEAEKFDPSSYDYMEWRSRAEQVLADKLPISMQAKWRGILRISMLFNLKTLATRNPLGNVILLALEDVKDIPGTAIDILVSKSKYSEGRTTLMMPIAKSKASVSGAKKGVKELWQDVINRVDTSPTRGKYELPRGRLYDNPIANFADYATRILLQAGDRPFYEAAKARRLVELEKLGITGEKANEFANLYALDRVFQNDSELAKKTMQIREHFGFPGTLIMPFAQTPANIFDKLLDYSPVGLAKAINQFAGVRKGAAFGQLEQKMFVDRLSRSFTGAGLAMLAAALYDKGLLTIHKSDSPKVNATETYQGKQQFSLKINDSYYSIDWADPIGSLMAAAAVFWSEFKDRDSLLEALEAGTAAGIDVVFSKSFLQGVTRLMSGWSPASSIASSLLGTSSQLTPTAGSQTARWMDDYEREVYDPSKVKQQLNYMQSRIPIAREFLPGKIDITGQPIKANQGRSGFEKFMEIYILPYNRSDIRHDPTVDKMYQIYEQVGDTEVLLRTAPKSFKSNGESIKLTQSEYVQFQKTMGKYAYEKAQRRLSGVSVENMTGEQLEKLSRELATINRNAYDRAKEEVLKKRASIPLSKKSY